MIPELGHFSLIIALVLAMALCLLTGAGVIKQKESWMQAGPSLALGLFVFTLISFACLATAFLQDDFSVNYVAQNSNTDLPDHYKIAAVWGAHEGSFLLWTLMMCGWTLGVALFSGSLTVSMRARVLSILGGLSIGFLLFLLLTSNPFERSLPVFPQNGSSLNPLLQDFGLIVHPPMLYMGYVGLAIPFAFAIATLTSGQLDSAWARWSRPWTNAAWAFLTVGITLGSWWAYYELGWGGWWFWDAVENASFMPWLVGTALIHSLAVTEKRGVFRSWTVLLAILAFSLSLLGAFVVRSGVLTSVHAFAVDPERGLFILAFLVLVIGGSLTLFAIKASRIKSTANYDMTSREALLLTNNLLLLAATAVVLLGTLFPLIYEAFTGGKKISVGPPYFNMLFVPLVLLLFAVMAIAPWSRWRSTPTTLLFKKQVPLLLASLLMMGICFFALADEFDLMVFLACSIAVWMLVNLAFNGYAKTANKAHRLKALLKLTPSYYGMWLAHAGIVVSILGVAITSGFSSERDVRLVVGDTVSLAGYEFTMKEIKEVKGPNYWAHQGVFEVFESSDPGKEHLLTRLYPEKRYYGEGSSVMTEADMDAGIFRDLFVALGEKLDDQGAWAVRIHYKPFVRWIWVGGLFIAFGGVLAMMDKRYRLTRRKRVPESASGLVHGHG